MSPDTAVGVPYNFRHASTRPLRESLTRHTEHMTQPSGAGIRRNRRPTGSVAIQFKTRLSEEAAEAVRQAMQDSGNISIGLYLERLFHDLQDSQGRLPVLAPQLDIHETSPNHSEANNRAA
jgi:hypothetical protein